MKIKSIVFDWDGTLFDSMSYKRSNFIELFSQFSIPTDQLTAFHIRESGIPRKDLFNKCLLDFTGKIFSESEYNIISAQYTSMNLESSKQTSPFPDALEGLSKLAALNLNLFVSSSSAHDELVQVVKNSGLLPFFKEILGSQPALNKGPEHINYLCKKYSLVKSEIIFIGDDEQDLILGAAAEITTLKIVRNDSNSNQISTISKILDKLEP